MARKKKTLGLSSLNQFKIKKTGPKYLPRTAESTEDKIFSQLVRSAVSKIGISEARSSSEDDISGSDSGGASQNAGFQTAFTSLLKGYISNSTNSGKNTVLFRPSQSQAAAEMLKTINLGRKNL